MLNIGTA